MICRQIDHELSDLECRTQSIELLVINATKGTTLRLMTDPDPATSETYFNSGGWFVPKTSSMTLDQLNLGPCKDKANVQVIQNLAFPSLSLSLKTNE